MEFANEWIKRAKEIVESDMDSMQKEEELVLLDLEFSFDEDVQFLKILNLRDKNYFDEVHEQIRNMIDLLEKERI